MYRAAELLAKGRPVAVLPEEEMLSTQEAADLLNVSRQYLVRLVDAGGEWTDFAPQQITVVSLMGMLYLALIGSVIGNTAYLWLLDRISAPIVATYTFINPLVAVILGVWVLGERITTPSLGGAALVIGSVAALLYVSNTDKPATRSSAKAHSR
jgi:EamA domain-containing membrane protein RarD